ncbi:leucyl aminopeptidase [Candidatus Peregrinibacteria bacterium]|nr:leucyl aminopeptidase [Candidatus Peregrinibacteria bacterium]
MKLRFTNKPSKTALLIYPVFEKEAVRDAGIKKIFAQLTKEKEFEAKLGQTFFLFEKAKSLPAHTLLLGLGKPEKLNVSEIMSAFGGAVKQTPHHRPHTIAIILPLQLHKYMQDIVEAAALASYQPSAPYKTGKALKKLKEQQVEMFEVVGADKKIQQAARKGLVIANAVNELRDWVNAPPNFATAKFFDEKAEEIAKETGAKLTILRKKELEKLNMGALLGVNRGSPDEARLTILDYMPANTDPKEPPLVFVGKGILFDSGGYNLKPRGYIEDMQLDKAGAAAVLTLIRLLPKLNIKRRIIGVAPFTENLIGKHALKPSEILKTYSGKTVEITNTDAEGRLVLSDALAYAVDQFKPKFLVDIATLTGACMVALGDRYAGLFGNDKDLMEKLRAAGEEVDELLWPMPLHKNHSEKMKGVYADLRNADLGSERNAGASKGAAFLQEFVGKTKWAHLDIAGPGWTEDPKKYEHKGATGFGVRVLARFLEKL